MYVLGANRLFYQASGFQVGLTITGKLIDKNLIAVQNNISFKEYEDGIYYADVSIPRYDSYLMRMFENGVLKLVWSLQVDQPWIQKGLVQYCGQPLG